MRPGVYRFVDEQGRIIYVGKAKNLRQRLTSYFQDLAALHPRTQKMVTTAAAVSWTVVQTEVEALALEYTWIKEFNPRFNVLFKDDKSYPYLALTTSETYPRAMVMRGARGKGNRYFGPYAHTWAIRQTLDLLLRVFPVRTCTKGVFQGAKRRGRPCLLGYINRCSAPCVGRISAEDHRALVEDMCRFLAGETGTFIADLKRRMEAASLELEFEEAAALRDSIAALEKVREQNAVVLPDGANLDIFGLATDDLEAAVAVFHVRGGRIRGQRAWVVERVDDTDEAGLLAALATQVYGANQAPGAGGRHFDVGDSGRQFVTDDGNRRSVDDTEHLPTGAIPPQILMPREPAGREQLEAWLGERAGRRVRISTAKRGDKAKLAQTVADNAAETLRLQKMRRAGDITQRSRALEDLRDLLGLAEAPLRIEGFDISHTAGTEQVGSMVVFEDGVARKNAYRHFVIRGPEGTGAADDTEAMSEVLRRRFRQREQGDKPVSGEIGPGESPRPARFAYHPNLLVVDGGLPQVNAAQRVLDELDVRGVALIGLAKRLEEVWIAGDDYPLILGRRSPGLYLLQRLRDESHRFAITHHRKRRSKRMHRSILEGVSGVGPARQKALLKEFGSPTALRGATEEEIASTAGIGPVLAGEIWRHLHPSTPAPEK